MVLSAIGFCRLHNRIWKTLTSHRFVVVFNKGKRAAWCVLTMKLMVFLLVLARIFWDWLETSGDLKGKGLRNFWNLISLRKHAPKLYFYWLLELVVLTFECRYIASDCDAVATVYEYQKYAKSAEDAVADVLKAGIFLCLCKFVVLLNYFPRFYMNWMVSKVF